jgi:hypothetical protein
MDGLASRIYHGVPRFAGELFRATKIPTIILLIGFIGVPAALSIYLAIYATSRQSMLVINLFAVGIPQFEVEASPSSATALPPDMAELLRTMSPEQKQQGKTIVAGLFMWGLVIAVAWIWWIDSAVRFLATIARRRRI